MVESKSFYAPVLCEREDCDTVLIIISKSKLIALSLILLFLVLPASSRVHGLTFSSNLPSNTLLFDDFEDYSGTSLAPKWWSCDSGTQGLSGCAPSSGGGASEFEGRNSTIAYNGQYSMEIRGGQTLSKNWDLRRTFAASSDLVTVHLMFAFNQQFKTIATGPAIDFSLEYFGWDSGTRYRFECQVVYTPSVPVWQYAHSSGTPGSAVADNIGIPSGNGGFTQRYYGWLLDSGDGVADGVARMYGTWIPLSFTCNRTTNSIVSVVTPEGIWTCGNGLNNGCALPEKIDSEIPNVSGQGSKVYGGEIDIGNGATATCTCEVRIDDYLVLDSSSSVTCGPLCLSTFNFGLALTSMMMISGSVMGFVYTEKFMGKGELDSKHIESANRWLKDAVRAMMFIFLGIGVIVGMSVIFGRG